MCDFNFLDDIEVMFDKILIVNCGEIVCCVVVMCKCFGIVSVVVYFDVDVNVKYVVVCDEVVYIGGLVVVDSYLCIECIIDVVCVIGV